MVTPFRIDNLKALCSGTKGEDEKAFSKVIKVDAEKKGNPMKKIRLFDISTGA